MNCVLTSSLYNPLFIILLGLCASGLLAEPIGKIYNVLDFGAVGNLKVMDTAAIQRAIDKCHDDGGGTVVLPTGFEFLSGTLLLKSKVVLHIQKGAMLRGSRDQSDYKKIIPDFPSFTANHPDISNCSLIQAINAENIGIEGKGVIDGDGVQMRLLKEYGRPNLIRFVRCKNAYVRDVILKNPCIWTQHYLECDYLRIEGIKVRSWNLDPHQPNGDGIDIDGCQHVIIENNDIESEDDGIVLKSTTMRPMEDVIIRNNTVKSNVNAMKIGTETHGFVRNIIFQDNRITFAGRSALTVQSVDGAHIEDITFENIIIDEAAAPIFLRLGNRGRPITPNGPRPGVGAMRNIVFRNIVAKDVKAALPPKKMLLSAGSAFSGIEGHKIENIVLENLDLTYAGGILDREKTYANVPENIDVYPNPNMFGELPAYAFYFRHVKGVRMENIYIRYLDRDYRSPMVFDDAQDIRLKQVFVQRDKKAAPVAAFFRGSEGAGVQATFIHALDRYRLEGYIPD